LRSSALSPRSAILPARPIVFGWRAGFDVGDTGTVTVVMTWLVPITAAEASYVRARSWPALEDALVAEDPDLVDLSRSPVTAVSDVGE
jgi:hypothetical protein